MIDIVMSVYEKVVAEFGKITIFCAIVMLNWGYYQNYIQKGYNY